MASVYDELVEFFEEEYKMETKDLLLDDKGRMALYGKLDMLDEIREIAEKGFPKDEEETE